MSPDLAFGATALLDSPAVARPASTVVGSGEFAARAAGLRKSPVAEVLTPPLAQLARAVVSERFPTRSIEVAAIPDGATGRVVYRVSDRLSGEVLMQEPAENLLRFYANARAASDRPLLTIDA
jgi:hypothetical protein